MNVLAKAKGYAMTCNKIKHFNPKTAQDHADRVGKANGVTPDIYQCQICKWWHVGYSREQRAAMSKGRRREYKRRKKA